jgi:hypothetical protein
MRGSIRWQRFNAKDLGKTASGTFQQKKERRFGLEFQLTNPMKLRRLPPMNLRGGAGRNLEQAVHCLMVDWCGRSKSNQAVHLP